MLWNVSGLVCETVQVLEVINFGNQVTGNFNFYRVQNFAFTQAVLTPGVLIDL